MPKYTAQEIREMSREEFEAAQANDFEKPHPSEPPSLPPPSQDPYAPTSWAESEFDFRVPSGQLCRMRKVPLAEMAANGMLDRLTRLPGLAMQAVHASEGKPPRRDADASVKDIVPLLNELLPLVVVRPIILPDPPKGERKKPGQVYVSDVDLMDQVAIMNRAIGDVQQYDAFRQ